MRTDDRPDDDGPDDDGQDDDRPDATGGTLELHVERLVAGGAGLSHEPDGRVVLVDGALPGDTVEVRLVRERPRMAEAAVERVVDPSADRVTPPCPAVERGCGGCGLQHADTRAQGRLKAGIVADALVRAVRGGDLDEVPIRLGDPVPAWGYRTTVRCGVVAGAAAFRRRRSNDLLVVDGCPVAHPLVEEVLRFGRFPGASEVTVRAGARTGEVLVVVAPRIGPGTSVPGSEDEDGRVNVVGLDELRKGRRAWYHEEVAGHRFRVSARSFFQSGPDGAEALVAGVGRALGPRESGDRLVDLYGGVGLFAATMETEAPVLVERSASSVADARVNLKGRDATVIKVAAERWRPSPADLTVADPARSGLGLEGVRVAAATRARRIALVSCDVAAMARDLVLFAGSGYRATAIEVVDMFPGTHHIEAVTTLEAL